MLYRFLLPCILLLSTFTANSQITFQKIFGSGTYCPYGSSNSDGSYICTIDTIGVVNYSYNGYGTPLWKNDVPLNGDLIPASIIKDVSGNYIFCGTILDSSNVASGIVARLDANGDTINYRIFPPLNDGNYGLIARPTLDNNYIFDMYEDGPMLSSSSTLYKLDIGFNILWSVQSGTSGISNSGILQDKDSNFVFTNYDQAAFTSIGIEKYNNQGISALTKTYNDTTSCSCFLSYCIAGAKGGGFVVGTEFQQTTMLIKIDDNFDTVWTRQLNWGNNTPVSITRDRDAGYFVLLNFQGKATMYHFDASGDSIATFQFNPMILTIGSRMERCPDGGYLINGTTYDYFNVPHGFLLKVDSLCRFTPQGQITSSGPFVFCQGDSITLTGPSGNYSYYWSTGDTTRAITVNSTGTYYLTITVTSGNTATLVPINVFVSNPGIPQIVNNITYLQATTPGTYQWYLNGVPIHGATHDTLQTTLTGNFNVVVTDTVGCVRVSPLFYYSWTGLTNQELIPFSIFPVPASEFISLQGEIQKSTFVIKDVQNKFIQRIENIPSDNFQLDVSSFSDGVYFLHSEGNENIFRKFVVIH